MRWAGRQGNWCRVSLRKICGGKVSGDDLDRILNEGGVTRQEESFWLLDFWGKKDVAGLLLMPPTRHVMLHLNDCFRWKEEIRTKKKFFLV